MSEPTIVTAPPRPVFPKRAIVTGGMPYGNKDLHFGHIGGVFIHADAFARFLRDRIGNENVIFVSGTDCYGSPIVEDHRKQVEEGRFSGTLEAFVARNHRVQLETLRAYNVEPDLFAASALEPHTGIHRDLGADLMRSWHVHGHIEQRRTPQFYDPDRGVFLNGRQVLGRCPVQGCRSEKAYADECSLGHSYEPSELINPRSALTGEKPEMRDVVNWYLRVPAFRELLKAWVDTEEASGLWRRTVISSMREHFEAPTLYITREHEEELDAIEAELPSHARREGRSKSWELAFERLADREQAAAILARNNVRFRAGKTLVPFRLTGNLGWGLPVPELDGLGGLTFWVWPESLWAPISFSMSYLRQQGKDADEWRRWWCSKDAKAYQFIGEDNVYFYSLPEMAMFLGTQGTGPAADPPDGQFQPPLLVANRHLLFLSKKASSSGAVKPPMARDLLEYYTSDQLRAHFLSLNLGARSVSFQPKPLNPKARERDGDPVLKEGNLLSNAFNRSVRSCFYTAQKFCEGRIPVGEVSPGVVEQSERLILDVEQAMHRQEFHQAIVLIGDYIREINKRWSVAKPYADDCESAARERALIDSFHMVRVATVMLHPIAPVGTEKVRQFLQVDESFWSWDSIFEPVYRFMADPEEHQLRFVPPRTDFFDKHPSQLS